MLSQYINDLNVSEENLFINPIISATGGATNSEKAFFKKYWRFIALPLIAYALYTGLFTDHPARWFFASLLISPVVIFSCDKITILNDVIPTSSIRSIIITVLSLLMLYAYGYGVTSAQSNKNDDSYVTINNETSDRVYLGRAGGHVFFWHDKAKNVEIIPENLIHSFLYQVKPQTAPLGFLFSNDGPFSEKATESE